MVPLFCPKASKEKSMIVVVDIRNKVVTVGIIQQDDVTAAMSEAAPEPLKWRSIRRYGAFHERTSDEFSQLISQMVAELVPDSAEAHGFVSQESGSKAPEPVVWISSVVPALTGVLAASVEAVFKVTPHIVGPGTRTGIKIRTDFPSELGTDLVCAAAGAKRLTSMPCLIVDFGVALTISAVNARGEFLGAAITAGPRIAAESLRQETAQLVEANLEFPASAIGKSTRHSICSGIMIGYTGLVRQLLLAMGRELRADEIKAGLLKMTGTDMDSLSGIEVIGTGEPEGREILNRLGYARFVPNLVLEGLAVIASKKQAS